MLSLVDGTRLAETVKESMDGESSADALASDIDKLDGTQTRRASNTASASTPQASILSRQDQALVDSSNKAWAIPLISAIFALLLVFKLTICSRYIRNRQKERHAKDTLRSVFKYLHALEVEDIDIRRSPVGGYHVSYINDLALGINKAEQYSEPEHSLTENLTERNSDVSSWKSDTSLQLDDDSESNETTSLSKGV
jgi:hypothetical protein